MYFPTLSLLLAVPVLSSVLPSKQDFLHDFTNEIRPAWRKEDDLTNVQLSKNARVGKVPPAVEEGLINAAGTRFANVFFDDIDKEGTLGSCWSCASAVIKESPCVYKAISSENPGALLQCGLDKDDVCKCTSCLPDPISKYVNQWCSSSADATTEVSDSVSYVDFSYIASYDPFVQGYRGDLKTYKAEEYRRGGITASTSRVLNGGLEPYGTCGCPNVCIGLCVFGSCTGVCA